MDFPRKLQLATGPANDFVVEWNTIPDALRKLAMRHLRVQPPLELHATSDGMLLALAHHEVRRFARLTAATFGGYSGAVAADLLDWNGTAWAADAARPQVLVYPRFAVGFFFANTEVELRYSEASEQWLLLGAGATYCWGTLQADLTIGASAPLSIASIGQLVTVFEQWGTADAGTMIGALWNSVEQRWEGALQRCEG